MPNSESEAPETNRATGANEAERVFYTANYDYRAEVVVGWRGAVIEFIARTTARINAHIRRFVLLGWLGARYRHTGWERIAPLNAIAYVGRVLWWTAEVFPIGISASITAPIIKRLVEQARRTPGAVEPVLHYRMGKRQH